MIQLFLAAALGAAATDATLTTLDGRTLKGELVELTAQRAQLQTAEGQQAVPLANVLRIVLRTSEAKTRPAVAALADGSQLAVMRYSASGRRAQISLAGGGTLDVPLAQLHWVRFAGAEAKPLDAEWEHILQSNPASDLLIVRKGGALDYLEGVLQDVDERTVRFQIEGELAPIKRSKVEGIIYYHPPRESQSEPLAVVEDTEGSRFVAQSVELASGKLRIKTASGIEHDLAMHQVGSLDFSAGKIVFLSDLEPEGLDYVPYLASPREPKELRKFFEPRRDVNYMGEPLELDGKRYEKGLWLHSRTKTRYRVPRGFRRFQAVVGIDDAVRSRGDALVKLTGDGRELWQGRVTGKVPAQKIDVKVEDTRHLEVLVDYGAQLDISDHVSLADAKFLK